MLTLGKKLNAEERLSKAVVAIMGHPRYMALSGVLMIGEKTIEENVPTACTNGRDVMFGREMVDALADSELRFVVLHEDEGHKLHKHLTIWRWMFDIDPHVANMACDYFINIRIVDDNRLDGFATMPTGKYQGLYDERFRGMDSAQIFRILLKEKEQEQEYGGENSIRDEGQDNESGGDDGQECSSTTGTQNTAIGSEGGFDEHDWEGAQALSDEEQRELARDIDEAIRQGAMASGKLGGTGSRGIDELLQPQVDWREVLCEFVQTTCSGNDYSTYARPNRRLMSQGIIMPSGISEQVDELVLAIDTSGSIEQPELTMFLSEVKGVCDTVKPNKVRILYWGSRVVGDEPYSMHELDDLVRSTKPKHGGGTEVNCVTQYMADEGIKPQACIVLTDGHLFGDWGKWTCPVLWAILDNRGAVPDNGKAVHIKKEDM